MDLHPKPYTVSVGKTTIPPSLIALTANCIPVSSHDIFKLFSFFNSWF